MTYHGTQHSGHVDGIPPPWAVFTGITQVFRIHIQDLKAGIQDPSFKLHTDKQKHIQQQCLLIFISLQMYKVVRLFVSDNKNSLQKGEWVQIKIISWELFLIL